jgi:Carboxypeptidase regulatory-like domain/Tetratricopeptide repeat
VNQRILASIGIVLGACAMLSAQTPQELFNKALVQERAAGNLEQAIQLYQRVAKESSSNDRSLAVQALMGAARSFQKLGQTAQSRNLYQQVARLYPEQREQAAIARESLADTGIVQGTVLRSGSAEPVPNAKVSLSGGPVDPAAFAQLQAFFKGRNVEISAPPNGLVDQKYLQYLADTATARGVSMANPAVQGAMRRFQSQNDARFTASSDVLGHFTIPDVPPGRYTVKSEREGFFPPPDDLSDANGATVTAGRTAIVEVSMVRGATVSGKITDASGQPQPNVTVQAYSVQYQNGFPILQPTVAKATNDQGEYRLFWLVSGEYLIAVTPGLAPGEGGAVSSTAAQPGPDGGLPAPRSFYPGTADIAQATPVFIRGDSPVSGIDILARKVPTFRVKGEIHSFVPIPSAPVGGFPQLTAFFAIRPRDTNTPDDFGTPTMSAMLHQDGNTFVGEFDINGVAPGSYDVRAWVPEENPDGGARLTFAHADVDVFSQDATGISLDIYPSVRVNGTVTVDGVVPSPAFRVWLQVDGALAKAGVYQGLAARASLVNNQTGAFMIPAVPTGHFRALMGSGMPPDLYVTDVRQGGLSVFDSGFDVGRDSPPPIQIMLKSGARTVEGMVRDVSGRPVMGATAVLVPPRERRYNRALYYTAKSDATGHFKIQGVAPGTYSLFSWQNMPDGAYFNDRFVSRNEDAGRKVNVTQASMSGADIRLIPAIGR